MRLNVAADYEYFGGNTMYDDAFYIDRISGQSLIRGRVEVCRSATQTWGVVCDDDWTNEDASVACQQLGFSPYGMLTSAHKLCFLLVIPSLTYLQVQFLSVLDQCSWSPLGLFLL